MQPPPELLTWIGSIGGIFAALATLIQFWFMWKNRDRVIFRVITASRFFEPWRSYDLKGVSWPGPPGTKPLIKDGDIRRAFIVLEIEFTNKFSREVTIERINIDDWMFADKLTQHLYPLKKDYRVFNLYSREQTGLDKVVKITSNETYALRIEILEDTDGPDWTSSHSRYVLDLPDTYRIGFSVAGQKIEKEIKFEPFEHYQARDYQSLEGMYRWSDDLLGEKPFFYGMYPPQGITRVKHRHTWLPRLTDWLKGTTKWIIYGSRYPYKQPTRFSVMVKKLKDLLTQDKT